MTSASHSYAQEFSGGLELGLPINKSDNYGLGVGASLRYEGPWGKQTYATIDAGLISFSGKTVAGTAQPTWNLIPLQAGIKYYFDEPSRGFYISGQLGVHFISIASKSEQDFGFASGVGYHLEKVDMGLRFQAILGSNNESYNFLGIRAAYILSENSTPHRRRR